MSSDIEDFYVERDGSLDGILPAAEWEHDGREHVALGDGWQLIVHDPEPVDQAEIHPDLRAAVPALAFRVSASLEPINPPDEAWALLDAVLDTIGSVLGGATYDPRTGYAIAWRDGQRVP